MLLPAEAELCNAVGITEEEYWHFVELTEAYNGKRPDAYGHLPDVRNDPVSLIITLVVGLALSAVSALLAPKPKEQKDPRQTKTEDLKGQSKFAPTNGFDAVQELATLGAIIPLVFARKGVRVKSQLLWSRMLSLDSGHQLQAVVLLSQGELQSEPDFAGYAIGDVLLENYTRGKVELSIRRDGGRLNKSDRYNEGGLAPLSYSDTFSVPYYDKIKPYFSGTRTPASQTEFGAYAPMPNGVRFRPNYELILIPDDADNDIKKDSKMKNRKVNKDEHQRRCAVRSSSNTTVHYRIDREVYKGDEYKPWGVADLESNNISAMTNADQNCSIGELYLCGTKLAICTYESTTMPWVKGLTKSYYFEWEEGKGLVDIKDVSDISRPYGVYTIQRAAVGIVTNNRECHVTEIGIKSTVWKKISGFPNVNSYPGVSTIKEYEKEGGNFTLGTIDKYVRRLSFFRVETRQLGGNRRWTRMTSYIFCISGNSPKELFNYIKIYQPFGQWEYRLHPVAGTEAFREHRGKSVMFLSPGREQAVVAGTHTIAWRGELKVLGEGIMSNPEWVLGEPPDTSGTVESVSPGKKGNTPGPLWEDAGTEFDRSSYIRLVDNSASSGSRRSYKYWFWKGVIVANSDAAITQVVVEGFRYTQGAKKTSAGSDGYDRWEIKKEKYLPRNAPTINRVVSATGGSGSGLKFRVLGYRNGAYSWSISSRGERYISGESVYIPTANATVRVTTDAIELIEESRNRYDAISDYPIYESETNSNDTSPEHAIAYINEIIAQPAPQYQGLGIVGLRLNGSTEWANFSDFSAYVKHGLKVSRLIENRRDSTNLLPEIAYALLTDKDWGAGTLIGTKQVDRARMKEAALFCDKNGFTWDGVVDESQNLREWIFEQAGYCLLDFTILGGRFSLVPSVPYKSNYSIDFNGKPSIKALFTDGNIRKMEVSFLGPEERQLFKAVCLYRQEYENGFAETRSVAVWLSGQQGGSADDPVETFDMGAFCTSRHHAETFAKYALKVRKEVDHGIKFETTPQAAMNLAPGEYFKLMSEVTHTSRFNNGTIAPDGTIQSTDAFADGKYQILYWEPGTEGVKTGQMVVINGKVSNSGLRGTVFTLKNTTADNRVYKVESLSYGEDGMVEVSGSFTPLTSSGSLAVLDWNQDDFVVGVN